MKTLSRRHGSGSLLIGLLALALGIGGCEAPSLSTSPTAPATRDDQLSPSEPESTASDDDTLAPPGPQTTDLYHSAKGDPKNPAVVYIHGGPGANSKMFELTAQASIARLGYYVVAYDQRGSTRSPEGAVADYSFAKATQDLDELVGALGLSSPILLGHSFGGSIALHYLERFKGKAKGAVIVASPMNFPETYDTTLTQCAARYAAWGRTTDARRVTALHAAMFPHGVNPPFAFAGADIDAVIACQNDAKLYFPEFPTAGELSFVLAGGLDPEVAAVNEAVGAAFHANDQVGFADFTPLLHAHRAEVHAIYAPTWDVMFSQHQLDTIRANVASFATVPDSGHFVFVDQPEAFVSTLSSTLSRMK